MERNKVITITLASLAVCGVLWLINRKRLANLFSRTIVRMDTGKDADFMSDIGKELLRSRKISK
jgi:hypothetical protein